jgi:hypothetical protein
MTPNYSKVWEAMNELESVTSKVCSAREILDSAIIALESGNKLKAETLMYAVDEFLEYYLEDFDKKFKTAWGETVVKIKKEDPSMLPCKQRALEYLSKDINHANNFPGEQYTKEELDSMCDAAEEQEKSTLQVQEIDSEDPDELGTKKMGIQTCGGYNPDDGYIFTICFGNRSCMSLDGLTKEDIYEIASCALCMLPDEEYRTLLSSNSDLN